MASLNNTNNYLESLIGASADAQNNLWEADFTGGNLTDVNTSLKVRCDSFTPPEISQEKYDVKFVTASIPRPAAKVKVNRTFSLSFRVDANYEVYKALLTQQKYTFSPTQGFAASDLSYFKDNGYLFTVAISAVNVGLQDIEPSTQVLYKFKNCWIDKIDALGFKVDSSSPLSVNVSFKFLQMEDLQSGIE